MPRTQTNQGFTLIEVLVIAPIIILFIGAFIALVVGLTGESLQVRAKNSMVYDSQSSLNDIEINASRATQFKSTTGTLQSKQGKNATATVSDTTPFTSTNSGAPDALIFTAVATDKSPYDSGRSIVYTGGTCDSANPLYTYTTIYFIASDQSLYKRQILSSSTPCTTPYQKGTCHSSVMQSSPPSYCMAADDLLMSNVTDFTVAYYNGATLTTDPTQANTIKLTLTTSRSIGGQSITYSADSQIVSTNIGAS
jgi:competence protein ComGC